MVSGYAIMKPSDRGHQNLQQMGWPGSTRCSSSSSRTGLHKVPCIKYNVPTERKPRAIPLTLHFRAPHAQVPPQWP